MKHLDTELWKCSACPRVFAASTKWCFTRAGSIPGNDHTSATSAQKPASRHPASMFLIFYFFPPYTFSNHFRSANMYGLYKRLHAGRNFPLHPRLSFRALLRRLLKRRPRTLKLCCDYTLIYKLCEIFGAVTYR